MILVILQASMLQFRCRPSLCRPDQLFSRHQSLRRDFGQTWGVTKGTLNQRAIETQGSYSRMWYSMVFYDMLEYSMVCKHKDPTHRGFRNPPLSWALELECEILMFMWSFGTLAPADGLLHARGFMCSCLMT